MTIDESFPSIDRRRGGDESELITTPSYVRIRRGLGEIASGTLMETELFPRLTSTFGKSTFTPDKLVGDVHDAVGEFVEQKMGARSRKTRINEMIVGDIALKVLTVLVPRKEQQREVLSIYSRLLETEEEEIKQAESTDPQRPRRKSNHKGKSKSKWLSQRELSMRQAKENQGRDNGGRKPTSASRGLKPRQPNKRDRKPKKN